MKYKLSCAEFDCVSAKLKRIRWSVEGEVYFTWHVSALAKNLFKFRQKHCVKSLFNLIYQWPRWHTRKKKYIYISLHLTGNMLNHLQALPLICTVAFSLSVQDSSSKLPQFVTFLKYDLSSFSCACLLAVWKTEIYMNVVNRAHSCYIHTLLSQIYTGMSVSRWLPCYFMQSSSLIKGQSSHFWTVFFFWSLFASFMAQAAALCGTGWLNYSSVQNNCTLRKSHM